MPVYCYRDSNGHVHEQVFPMGRAPKSMHIRGRHAVRDFAAEQKQMPARKGWPMECFASGVHPSQAGELRDFLRKKGVPTTVTPDGNPVYRDAGHRKKALKARNIVDKAAYC